MHIPKMTAEKLIPNVALMAVLTVSFGIGDIPVQAQENAPKTAKEGIQEVSDEKIEFEQVNRKEKLKNFLEKYNSPMADNAETFIEVADKYGHDYRLLPAISCMESGCGHHLIEGTYNPFGWGIYGNQYIAFESYDEAIREVGKGIYEGYAAKGADTPEKMAPIYTPPNSANWLFGVRTFMREISETPVS